MCLLQVEEPARQPGVVVFGSHDGPDALDGRTASGQFAESSLVAAIDGEGRSDDERCTQHDRGDLQCGVVGRSQSVDLRTIGGGFDDGLVLVGPVGVVVGRREGDREDRNDDESECHDRRSDHRGHLHEGSPPSPCRLRHHPGEK